MISAGVLAIFAKSILTQPTKKAAKKVAMARFEKPKKSVKTKRKLCPIAATRADKNKMLVGVSVTLLLFFEQSFMTTRHSGLFGKYRHLKRHKLR